MSRHRLLTHLAVICSLAVFGAILTGSSWHVAQANSISVTSNADNTTHACFYGGLCTLRDAIDSAAPDDTITFAITGTITLTKGVLTIDKNLTITGPGVSNLTIDGNQTTGVFEITSGEVTISDLTIGNAHAPEGSSANGGAVVNSGILHLIDDVFGANSGVLGGAINNNGILSIDLCTITGNSATGSSGGGIYNDKGRMSLSRSTISRNQANRFGGGIFNIGGTLHIENSTFADNQSEEGGGLHINTATATISGSTFTGNQANSAGGGIFNIGGTLHIENNTFADNQSEVGGGLYNNITAATISGSTFTGNQANSAGGAIYGLHSALEIDHGLISNNSSGSGGGGGLSVDYGTLFISDSQILANKSDGSGGAINNNGTLNVASSTISGNSGGGGIYNESTAYISASFIIRN